MKKLVWFILYLFGFWPKTGFLTTKEEREKELALEEAKKRRPFEYDLKLELKKQKKK